jgi:hypothetical protein
MNLSGHVINYTIIIDKQRLRIGVCLLFVFLLCFFLRIDPFVPATARIRLELRPAPIPRTRKADRSSSSRSEGVRSTIVDREATLNDRGLGRCALVRARGRADAEVASTERPQKSSSSSAVRRGRSSVPHATCYCYV